MNTFPTLSTGPKIEGFTDEYVEGAVALVDLKSGYPLLIPRFNFVPRNFRFTRRLVSQTDKKIIEVFYQANKDLNFNWLNDQDSVTYEVIFADKPSCMLDGAKDEWRIEINLIQAF